MNLKTKQALGVTMDMFIEDRPKTFMSDTKITACPPCYGLSTFSGNIWVENSFWIDSKQLLLRGSNLKNTHFIIGAVVYTGHDTKIMMNQKTTPFKRSQFENILNKIVIFQLIIQTGLCIFLAISSVSFDRNNNKSIYIYNPDDNPWVIGSTTYFSFFLLLNSLIPISMIVSLELVKFIQSFFVQFDMKMYSEEQDRPAKVISLSILEELGAVDYIFCDKTGTLTANVMEFKACCIAGSTYSMGINKINSDVKSEHIDTHRNMINTHQEDVSPINEIIHEITLGYDSSRSYEFTISGQTFKTQKDYINEFLLALVLCNDVVTDKAHPDNLYLSSSPDEVALIKAAKDMGYEFIERTHKGISVKIQDTQKFFEILAINDFTSERKRMSVLIKHPDDGSFRLYIKGADEAISQLINKDIENPSFPDISDALKDFAMQGLRTLDVAFKVIDDCQDWISKYSDVKCTPSKDQKEKLEALAEEIEKDIWLLGITAVEDRLQKHVPKAIQEFNEAGIHVWMITGDKLETAENIAYTCNMLNRDWNMYCVRNTSNIKERLESIEKDIINAKSSCKDIGIIIEGDALAVAIESHRKLLYSICKRAKGVVCCRATPKQKAKVVNFIKKMDDKAKTLAIGDGGNDTSMIQSAHVGVGIYGKEGHQAADCSDFAIAEFRFLRYLIFVHGRWNSRRIGFFILYFFFKNLVFTLIQGYFAFNSGFSGQTIWDDWYLLLFNSAITAAGIMCYSLWDQDINARTDPEIKRFWPTLYKSNKDHLPLTMKKYFIFSGWGIFCSFAVYLICTRSFSSILNNKGYVEIMWDLSTCMYSSVIIIVGIILIIKMKSWSWIQHVTIWGLGFALYCPVFMFIYDLIPGTYVYANTADFLSIPTFWLAGLLCIGVCTFPYYAVYLYCELFHPSNGDLVFQRKFSPFVPGRRIEHSVNEKIETMHSSNSGKKRNSV